MIKRFSMLHARPGTSDYRLVFTAGFGAIAAAVALLVTLLFPCSSQAFFQPEYQNRGNTTFLDGFVPKQGWIYQTYLYNFSSDHIEGGEKIGVQDADLSTSVWMHQVCYVSRKRLLGGFLGLEGIVPWVEGHLMTDAGRSTDRGLGDSYIGGFIQSDEKQLRLAGRSFPFYWRQAAGVFVPIGDYDHEDAFSIGQNIFTLHLYSANTIFLRPRWTASWRLMYNLHTRNDEFGPAKQDFTPGQLFNVHFSSCVRIVQELRVGLIGDYWVQTTDNKLDGHSAWGRERAFSFGPGMVVSRMVGDTSVCVFLHAMFDTQVRNRAKGRMLQARVAMMF